MNSGGLFQLGLKLWSVNTGKSVQEARRLYAAGVFDYLELYVVPGTLSTLAEWKTLEMPVVIHAPHFKHGFNLALPGAEDRNRAIYDETRHFADELNARYIIFHGGTSGCIAETSRQLAALNEPRALVDNKPCILECLGSSVAEIRQVVQETGCGVCLDIPHALCAANYRGGAQLPLLQAFNALQPVMYHLADMMDPAQHIDDHTRLGLGNLEMDTLLPPILRPGAMITIETTRSHPHALEEFEREVEWFQRFLQRSMVL